jgi:hypothetical protein
VLYANQSLLIASATDMVTIAQAKWKPDLSVIYKNTPLLIIISFINKKQFEGGFSVR